MSTDVMRNPPTVSTTLVWYRRADTTPFAVAGYEGPLLAVLNADRYGPGTHQVWFIGGEWQDDDGMAFDEADVLAFAIPGVPDLKALGVAA